MNQIKNKRTAFSTWKMLLGMVVLSIAMASCSKKIPSSISIEAHDIEIENVASNQLAVAEDVYNLNAGKKSSDSDLWYLTLRIKLISDMPIEEPNNAVLQLLDENGEQLASLQLGENGLDVKTAAEFRQFASEGNGGAQHIFCFYLTTTDEEEVRNIMENTKTFKITDIVIDVQEYISGEVITSYASDVDVDDDSDDANYSDSNTSSNSTDWDAILSSYEQYVDKYISYVKKAANGDMNALAEYPSLMEKAQEFSDKMSNAQDDMTAAQWSRYMKITNKMSTAMQEQR